jgi:hypothetical protein
LRKRAVMSFIQVVERHTSGIEEPHDLDVIS